MNAKIYFSFILVSALLSCRVSKTHKTVICIPVYGQSLALGVDANLITDFDSLANYANGRIVTEYLDHQFGYYDHNEIKLFAKKILRHRKRSFELTSYSMAQWLADNTGQDTVICIFTGGQDGTIIANLGKGSQPYEKLLNDIKTAYQTAKDRGWNFMMPALCWMQGETDVNSYPKTNYRKLLLQFCEDINEDVKRITQQKNNLEFICYQTNSLTRAEHFNSLAYQCPETEVPQTQLELVRDNPFFHASGPTYPYDCVNEIIHIDGLGQKRHGILAALAAYSILHHKNNKHGLLPRKVECQGMDVVIDFSVPYPPLHFDTTLVSKATNYGFSIITPDNRNIAKEVILQDSSVLISCSEPPNNCYVRYAINGDYMKSGRIHGPRGNLRDSQGDSLSITIQGKDYPIHNWCYQFDIHIQ